MKKTRKVLALVLALAMSLSMLSGCGNNGCETPSGSTSAGASTGVNENLPDKTLKLNISENMKSLDPHYQSTLAGKVMSQMYLDTLILYDETTGEFFPWLCESYEYSDDGLIWTYHMKDGLKWSNGEILDANDVAYTFQRLMDNKTDSPIAVQYWKELIDVELVDNLTVTLTFDAAKANMRVCLVKTYIIPDEAHKAQGDDLFHSQKCPASGPWVLTEWVDGQHVKFEKNDSYWNKDWFDSYYDNVEVRMITESSTAITAHTAGDVQAYLPSGGIPVDMLPLYDNSKDKIVVNGAISGNFAYAGMSFAEGSPFRDENVRWAFEYAVDRQGIVDHIIGGGAVPKSEALEIFGTNMGYDPDLEPYKYDPELAKSYLAKSSYKGEHFEIVTNNGFNKSEDIALYISECLNNVGFNTTVKVVEVAELISIRAEGTYTLFVINNMNGCGDIGNDMNTRLVTDAHHSFFEAAEPALYKEMADFINASNKEMDPVKRGQLTASAMRVIRENAGPHSYLCQYLGYFAIDKGVTGLEPFADGTMRLAFATYDPASTGNEFPDFSQFIQ